MLQPELLQECNSSPIYLTSLICAALIISQLSQFTAVAREHPCLWRRYSFQHRGWVFTQITQRNGLQIISSWQRPFPGLAECTTLPGTRAPFPSVSHGISWPPCTAARHHTLRENVPKFRDCNRATKAQRCAPLEGVLWFGISQFPWAPVTTCWASEPSLEDQGMEHKSAVGGNSYTKKPEHDTHTEQREGTKAQHCIFPSSLSWALTLTRRPQSPADGTGHHKTTASTLHCAPCPGACRSLTNIQEPWMRSFTFLLRDFVPASRLSSLLSSSLLLLTMQTQLHTFTESQNIVSQKGPTRIESSS